MRLSYRPSLDYLGCNAMTDSSYIVLTKPQEYIALLTLNRPEKRNALNHLFIQEWIHVLQKIKDDSSIRVVLLNGNGEHFCAGADIVGMQKMAHATRSENVDDALQLAELLKTIFNFPKPVIGLIHGATMGGGLGVIACCDIVVAATDSVFCFSEVKMGLTPSVISPYVLSVMGERSARYYFLTAEKFNAKMATELNLVQHSVPLESLFETGMTLAKNLLKNSPHALSEAKQLITKVSGKTISSDIILMTAEHLAYMRATNDAQEGLNAFLEKRSPVWE